MPKELVSQITPCRKRNDYAESGHDSVARLVPLKHLALRTSMILGIGDVVPCGWGHDSFVSNLMYEPIERCTLVPAAP